ncbi:hypothetical protein E2C01_024510 [Portunus trituberculatus]|uniref:Uncharacterized protein n=1 Tax=Portunus trituberculatus TaxID=210409 RepID=A0A5B7EDC7_PORTR|nr:hypothetical protein [Portunus trituberculatus]
MHLRKVQTMITKPFQFTKPTNHKNTSTKHVGVPTLALNKHTHCPASLLLLTQAERLPWLS